jgi:hypothetical protein
MNESNRQRWLDAPRYEGKEIFEIKPVILGGNPTDPANKTLLSREDHIKAVIYWNKIIADRRAKRTAGRQ